MTTQRWTLLVVSVATAMLMLDIAVVNTALPRIAEDLDASLSGLQWVVDAYTLALATTVLTAGALADRLGRRRLFAIGLVVFTLSSAAAAMAGSIEVLNTARAVQGIGGAILFAVSLALLAQAYPGKKERAGALAVYGATIGGSFAFGPLVGGALTSGLDWQWVFLINIPIGIFALWITMKHVVESRDERPRGLDWPGQITLTAGLGLLVLGLLRGNEDGWTSTPIVLELGGAVAFLAAFVLIESRVREPMLPLGMFRKKSFTGAQIAAFSISGSLYAVYIYATLYLQGVLGLSAVEAGLVLLPGTIFNFVVAGATAQILERGVKPGALIAAGLALSAARARPDDAGRSRLVLDDAAAGHDRRHDRRRAVQPGGDRGRARRRARVGQRLGRRHQRHRAPGRHRGRRRRARRPHSVGVGAGRRRGRVRRRAAQRTAGGRGALGDWRGSDRVADRRAPRFAVGVVGRAREAGDGSRVDAAAKPRPRRRSGGVVEVAEPVVEQPQPPRRWRA